MELVKHNNHVLKNFQLFIWLRDSHPDKVEQYRDCAEETHRFIAFCAKHEVVREFDKPLKFIFMRFKPSSSAIPVSSTPTYH